VRNFRILAFGSLRRSGRDRPEAGDAEYLIGGERDDFEQTVITALRRKEYLLGRF